MSTMADIQAKIAETDARLSELRNEIERLEEERREYDTALRVISRLSGVKPPPYKSAHLPAVEARARPPKDKKALIYGQIGKGAGNAVSPAEVYQALKARGISDISIQIIRSTMWRGANKYRELESWDGSYWLPESEGELFNKPSDSNPIAGMTTGSTQPDARSNGQEASHNAPFEPERGGGTRGQSHRKTQR